MVIIIESALSVIASLAGDQKDRGMWQHRMPGGINSLSGNYNKCFLIWDSIGPFLLKLCSDSIILTHPV